MGPVPYLVMKVLHVFAAMMFLGSITISILWKAHGDRTRDPRIIAHTIQGIRLSDRWFTMPGVTILLIAGFGAQGMGKYPFTTIWILAGIILIALSGFVFMARVSPVQRRLQQIAQAGISGEMEWSEYDRLSKQWNLWGMIATGAPVLAFVLMIWKPV
ncbi:MAG: DUF2269 family protein [Candidatus Eisenbacteria bacterium]|uniref:DUF2269 domain-containing protein n=1 Tax=Eiseniibacteriota bacterium TaxID=2212470 RepID=A0A956LZ24_UNCEI|nr:DUF2269 domain-containing protein [Candidatus Eisenbacteria bacterium]